jgi:predicted DsbA family dithiol-disulfide isomerase
MSPTTDEHPTVTQYTDPMCTWCWGSAPIIRRLKLTYDDRLRIEYVMGGPIEDFDEFYDSANDIAEPSEVGPHWSDASEMHGMPVNTDIFEVDPAYSTYPASVAFVAARQEDRELGHRYLRRLREAYATQVRNINHRDEQLEIAESVELDVAEFTTALDDGTARADFEVDLERTRRAGVGAFPTYHVTGSEGERWLDGFQSVGTLAKALADVAPALDQRSRRDAGCGGSL